MHKKNTPSRKIINILKIYLEQIKMKLINQNKLFRLFLLLSNRRKKQIRLLLILIVINGIFESLSVSAIIPF